MGNNYLKFYSLNKCLSHFPVYMAFIKKDIENRILNKHILSLISWRLKSKGRDAIGQKDRVGRPWTDFPEIYQMYNSLQSNYLWEWPEQQQKQFSTTEDRKKESQGERQEWQRCCTVRIHSFNRQSTNGRNIKITATVGAPSQGSYNRKMRPWNICLWKLEGFMFGRCEGLQETETLISKDAHKISHAWNPRKNAIVWKRLGHTHALILKNLLERQKASGTHHEDRDASGRNLGELFLLQKHWCYQTPFWNPPSIL